MIHGGGHMIFSRKDVRPHQTKYLLDRGLLPVSLDYRLCPKINLLDGAITDVCDALYWAQTELPAIVKMSGMKADKNKIFVMGWSTGAMLAMSSAWTAPAKGVVPPRAILAFYGPTDYEDLGAYCQPSHTRSMLCTYGLSWAQSGRSRAREDTPSLR